MSSDRRLTARGRDRKDQLIRFATRQFAEHGFHPTSVADIVDGIGVGKGVFYWYFPSKDDLLLEILRDALYDLRSTQRAALEGVDNPLERLERGIRVSLRWYAEHPEVLRLVTFGWTEDTFAAALEKGRRVSIADTARHVSAAIDAGLIPSGDPQLMATAIRGVTDELGRTYLTEPHSAETAERVADHAVRMCLGGVVAGDS